MPKDHLYFVYIMASKRNGTLYVGMSNDVMYRAKQHKDGEGGYFTRKHKVDKLVWYEQHQYVNNAIAREKIVKKYLRKEKLALIEAMNPQWHDFAGDEGSS